MNDLQKMSALEMLDAARSFDMKNIVDRYCKEQNESIERGNKIADELRHFLILCALDKSKGYAIRNPIDEMWHIFIIFTKDYFNFCRKLGRPYIHHAPTEEGTKKLRAKERLDSYIELLSDYRTSFGYDAPKDVWPEPGYALKNSPSCSSAPSDCGADCSYYPPCCNKP
jgi:hypothetical protein